MKGYKVLFAPVSEMLHNLNAAKADNTYYQKVDYYLKPDLLILDELGFKGYPDTVLMISLKSSLKGMKRGRLLLLPIKLLNNGEISLLIIS